jgi:hypothetical protein
MKFIASYALLIGTFIGLIPKIGVMNNLALPSFGTCLMMRHG